MAAEVLILGGGVGGTIVANLVAKQTAGRAHVTVVDATGIHVYQPGFLYVAVGQEKPSALQRPERQLLRHDVSLVVDRATRVDPAGRQVQLESGATLPYDQLLLATGSRTVMSEVPGGVAAHDFYTMAGAGRLFKALAAFQEGTIVIGVAGIPYKCPPAPVEFVFLLDDYLRGRGIRDKVQIKLLSPLNRAFTIEATSKLVQPILAERGIELTGFFNVESVDPVGRTVTSLEGETVSYDLLVLVPPHRGQNVIEDSVGGGGGDIGGGERRGAPRACLRRQGHVLPGDRPGTGHDDPLRLRPPAGLALTGAPMALGQSAVQQDLLAHRPAGTAALTKGDRMSITIATSLDLKGLSCPLPIIKTAKAMKELAPGQLLEAFATDPGSVSDFKAWAKVTGNPLVEAGEDGGVYRFVLRKKEA